MASVTGCHLVGSVPLPDSETVFRQAMALMPGRLRRVPDGETGHRHWFTTFQAPLFAAYPPMMNEFKHNAVIDNAEFTPEQIEEGIKALKEANIQTGYDDEAIKSYGVFRKLRHEGVIPAGVKFQVCIPGITNVLLPFVQKAFQARVEPIYEEALARAIRRIQDEIPHEDLAFQLDLASDTALWEAASRDEVPKESGLTWFQKWWKGDVKQYQTDQAVRVASRIDQDVEFGIHNCYGDMEHKHWHEPESLAIVVERQIRLMKASPHKINFMHCPVPKSAKHNIDAYLAPLKDLIPLLEEHGTEVYLGLIHEHKPELTQQYIEAASKVLPVFGVSTECGGGRMEWPDFENAMDIANEMSEPVMLVNGAMSDGGSEIDAGLDRPHGIGIFKSVTVSVQ